MNWLAESTLVRARFGATVFALLAAPVCCASDAWHADTATVLELLRADAQRAMASLAPVLPAPQEATTAVAPRQAQVRLAKLYGTAGQFTAVVYVDDVRKEYRPGASLPYGSRGGSAEYRLVRIVDTCVVLRRGGGGPIRTACFAPQPEPSGAPVAAAIGTDVLNAPLPARAAAHQGAW